MRKYVQSQHDSSYIVETYAIPTSTLGGLGDDPGFPGESDFSGARDIEGI